MKSVIILLLSLVCLNAHVVFSGRVAISGKVTAKIPEASPAAPSVEFSDFHYSSNFDSNNTTRTVASTPPSATITAGWTNAIGSIVLTGGDVTYDVYFKLDGNSALCTNFGFNISTEGDFGHTYSLQVSIKGNADDYDAGAELFSLFVPLVWAYDENDGPFIESNFGNTAINPSSDVVYVHMSYRLLGATGSFYVRDFNFRLNE